MRRTPLATMTVAVLLAATGCGGQAKTDEPLGPVGDEADSPSASPSAKASAGSSSDAQTFDDKGSEILRGAVAGAETPEAQAVVEAWFAYWDVRAKSFGSAEVDPKLGSVAAGDAVADVVRYVAYLRKNKLRTVGDTKLGVSDLKVDRTSATLSSCGVNKSIDRRADGSPAEQLSPYFTIAGTLTQAGGTWRVVETKVTSRTPCQA